MSVPPRHVLDVKNSVYRDSVFCNEKDPNERCMLEPFILTEIKREIVEDVGLDWTKAGADFYEAWLNMGKGIKGQERTQGRTYPVDEHRHNGARILSRGYVFMAAIP